MTLIRLAILLLLAGISIISCKSAETPKPPPVKVTVSFPVEETLVAWDEYTGRLESSKTVNVAARVSGIIESAKFEEGALVKAGDVLFMIDPKPFEAELVSREADLKKAKSRLAQSSANFKRYDQLKGTKAISAADYDVAKADLEQAGAEVGVAEAAVSVAKLNLEWTRVTAPLDGKISRKLVTEGNLISGGGREATVLSVLTALDPIYCYINVPERSFLDYRETSYFKQGNLPASLKLENETDFLHHGVVDFTDNRIDPGTGTLLVRASFVNDSKLLPGLFARVRIPAGEPAKTILVPDSAIGTNQNARFVLVVDAEGTVQSRNVTLGTLFGNLRAIKEGVNVSERIVTIGVQQAKPGSKVIATEVPIDVKVLEPFRPNRLERNKAGEN